MVAPPTSGQPEELESQVYDPLRSAQAGGPASGGTRPSPRDQWFLEERPPHWG